jgi:thioesterase domain-containing protein
MSLQLEAAGEEVAFLGILDTTPRTPPDDAPRHLWRALGNAPRWFWHDAIRTPWRGNVDRLRRAFRMVGRALGLSRDASRREQGADVREMMNVDRLPAAIQHRYEWDYRAFRAYQPSRPCGPVTVVKASAQPLLASHAPDMGWSAVSRGPVHVVEVPGSHTSILLEPGVQRLAEELKAALDRA